LSELPASHPICGCDSSLTVARTWIDKWLSGYFVVPTVRAVLNSLGQESNPAARIVEAVGDLPIREGVAELVLGSSEIQESRTGVTVCTVHQAKGLQFPAVIAVCGGVKETSEEDRVALVQATRAQERLHVIDNHISPGPLARATWAATTQLLKEEMSDD